MFKRLFKLMSSPAVTANFWIPLSHTLAWSVGFLVFWIPFLLIINP